MASVINDLFDYGLKIYQYDDKFKFSLDSILLAEFVELKNNTSLIVDFCTGNAPVPLILSTKTKARISGFEIQPKIAKLAQLSVMENQLDNQIDIINANLSEALEYVLPESADAVTCNPPYFKRQDNSLVNEDPEKAIARHEITMDLEDIMIAARYILKDKAPLYLVHRCDRLDEIFTLLEKNKFKIKKLQFVYASYEKEAIMVLVKATKNGKSGSLKVNPPLNVMKYKSYKGIFESGDSSEDDSGIGQSGK